MEKPVVGQVLYSLNVGNAARHREQKLTPVKVTKVGRKYFTCCPEGGGFYSETKYRIDSWSQHTDYLADSALYKTKQGWKDEKECHLIRGFFRTFFDYRGGCDKLPLDILRKVKDLVEPYDSSE